MFPFPPLFRTSRIGIYDNFNRADNADIGVKWTALGGPKSSFTISNNTLASKPGAFDGSSYTDVLPRSVIVPSGVSTSVVDRMVKCDSFVRTSNQESPFIGLALCAIDPLNFMFAYSIGSGITIFTIVNGSSDPQISGSKSSAADPIRFYRKGNTVYVQYFNGISWLNGINLSVPAALQGSNNFGIGVFPIINRSGGSPASLDNFDYGVAP